MTDDRGKTGKQFIDRLEKAKGRLRQSFPGMQQRVRTSGAAGIARQIIDPARSVFRQFADDIQLKDLFAKAEALVASADPASAKAVPEETDQTPALRGETPSSRFSRKAGTRKAASKQARAKKAAPKKTFPKKKKPTPKRKAKRLP